MAALDPSSIERELEALRRQRFEASQRVKASRQPVGPAPRSTAVEPVGTRPSLVSSRFERAERLGGPPSARGDGPRAGPAFRDGPLAGRLGPGPQSRGPLGAALDAAPRGRFDSGPSGRSGGGSFRDSRGGAGEAPVPAPAPTRRRALQSMVVSEREPQRDAGDERAHPADRDPDHGRDRATGRNRSRSPIRDRDERDSTRRQPAHEREVGDQRHDRDRDWGQPGRAPGHGQDHDVEAEGAVGEGRGLTAGRGLKRPAPTSSVGPPGPGAGGAAADPDSRKRARRLLGRALLGTLQKFRQEDAQFQASEAAARRAELSRKAEEKAAAESERLRRAAAEERSRKRQEELEELMDLNLATDIKVLELLYAKKLARRRALAAFLRADGVPPPSGGKGGSSAASAFVQPQPVYWLPAQHCEATLAVKERQAQELRDWEEAVLAELELEKDGLRQRAQARREGMAERRQRAAEARAAGQAAGGDGGAAGQAAAEEEEAEDHEALEAVELDAHHDEHGLEAEAEVEAEAHMEEAHEAAVEAEAAEPAGAEAKADWEATRPTGGSRNGEPSGSKAAAADDTMEAEAGAVEAKAEAAKDQTDALGKDDPMA